MVGRESVARVSMTHEGGEWVVRSRRRVPVVSTVEPERGNGGAREDQDARLYQAVVRAMRKHQVVKKKISKAVGNSDGVAKSLLVQVTVEPLAVQHPLFATASILCDIAQSLDGLLHLAPPVIILLHICQDFLLQIPY